MPVKATTAPIAAGGEASGFIQALLRDMNYSDMLGGKVIVTFADVNGAPYSVEHEVRAGERAEQIDISDLQQYKRKRH